MSSSKFETILVDRKDRVGIITLNRPDHLNAMNQTMHKELRDQIESFNDDSTIGAIVITGSGRAYSAGADISDFENREFRGSPVDSFLPKWPDFIKYSKPVICALNGVSVGLGITMPLSCDIRIMSESAKASFRFAYIGLVPEYASSHLLIQAVGHGKAMEFMLTGKMIDSKEALSSGLVNYVYPDDVMLDKSIELASQIAFNPEWQLGEIKKMMREHQFLDDTNQVMENEMDIFNEAAKTDAHKEFLTSFREKRKPNYH